MGYANTRRGEERQHQYANAMATQAPRDINAELLDEANLLTDAGWNAYCDRHNARVAAQGGDLMGVLIGIFKAAERTRNARLRLLTPSGYAAELEDRKERESEYIRREELEFLRNARLRWQSADNKLSQLAAMVGMQFPPLSN